MDLSLIQIFSYIIIPLLGVLVVPAIRGLYMRVNNLEQQMLTKISDAQARQLLEDKIDPVQADLREIKGQLNQIINRLIDNGRTN